MAHSEAQTSQLAQLQHLTTAMAANPFVGPTGAKLVNDWGMHTITCTDGIPQKQAAKVRSDLRAVIGVVLPQGLGNRKPTQQSDYGAAATPVTPAASAAVVTPATPATPVTPVTPAASAAAATPATLLQPTDQLAELAAANARLQKENKEISEQVNRLTVQRNELQNKVNVYERRKRRAQTAAEDGSTAIADTAHNEMVLRSGRKKMRVATANGKAIQ